MYFINQVKITLADLSTIHTIVSFCIMTFSFSENTKSKVFLLFILPGWKRGKFFKLTKLYFQLKISIVYYTLL